MNKRPRPGNRGLTLIELIISVAILGIIAAPLLHAFVTSAATSAKSRKMGNATLAAQNIAEALEATGTGDVAALTTLAGGSVSGRVYALDYSDLDAAGSPTLPHTDASNAQYYTFRLTGVPSGGASSSSRSHFDASVTLDATSFAATNTAKVTKYTPMDAVFSQPGERYENPDFLTADLFSDRTYALSGAGHSASYILPRMDRRIVVDLVRNAAKNEMTVSTTFSYSYTYDYTTSRLNPDGTRTTESHSEDMTKDFTYDFFRGHITGADSLSSIYFFYYPHYASGLESKDDTITINNPDDNIVSIFIVKQRAITLTSAGAAADMAANDISSAEVTYPSRTMLNLMQSINAVDTKATVSSNIGSNPAAGTSGTFTYRSYLGTAFYRNVVITGDLVEKEQQNRMYGVTVSVFDPGGTAPLFTLRSSKLD